MKTRTDTGKTPSSKKPQEMRNLSVEPTRLHPSPADAGEGGARHIEQAAEPVDTRVRVKVHLAGSEVRGEPGDLGETMVSHTVLTLLKEEADALVATGKATYV